MKQRIGDRLLAMVLCLCLLMNMIGADAAVALAEAISEAVTISDTPQEEPTVEEEQEPAVPAKPEAPAQPEPQEPAAPETPVQPEPEAPAQPEPAEPKAPEQPEPEVTAEPEMTEQPDATEEPAPEPTESVPEETMAPEPVETPTPEPTETPEPRQTPEPEAIFGDVNEDGAVNLDDLLSLLESGISLREARSLMPLTILENQLVEGDAFEAELWSDEDGTRVQTLNYSALMSRAGRWNGLRTGELCDSELLYRASDYPALAGYAFACVTYDDDVVTELGMLAITDVDGSVQKAIYLSTVDKYGAVGFVVLPEGEKLVLRYVASAQEEADAQQPEEDEGEQSGETDSEQPGEDDAAQPVPPTLPGDGSDLPVIPVPGWVPSEATPGEATPGEATPSEATPGEATPSEATPGEAEGLDEDDLSAWIEEQLRALEEQYNSGIMPLAFVVGYIPWDDYFTVSGLPADILSEEEKAAGKTVTEKWFEDCAEVSSEGYNVDNTGVKYTKFPQYLDEGIHFGSVTVNGVEVVRAGILMPDTGSGKPIYYYMTQKHVDSDSNDGSGSHTGSVSALVLPEKAKFQVNYAVNEYKLSYSIVMGDPGDVNDEGKLDPSKYDGADIKDDVFSGSGNTWENTIFAGQNPSSTNNGEASLPVTIPYGYTARLYQKLDGGTGWKEITGKRPKEPDHEVNEGYPLGMEPVYLQADAGAKVAGNSPSAKRMSAVFYAERITENREIRVVLFKDTQTPVFDAHFWLGTDNAKNRGSTAENNNGKPDLSSGGKGNIGTEDKWDWTTGGVLKDPPNINDSTYKKHWYQETDGTWTLLWGFQTNTGDEFVLNSLELNGVYIDVPFRPLYKWENGADVANEDKQGTSITTATLPDGAQVELTFYRYFYTGKQPQRVYILKITGARSNITVTGGNFMQYAGGAPEYVATVLAGVTAEDNESDTFGYYKGNGEWGVEQKTHIQVQSSEVTDFKGDPKHKYANLRFRLQTGYEDPYYLWEDRMTTTTLQSGSTVKPWDDDLDVLEPGYIYGPKADEDGREWYYIRIDPSNKPDKNSGHKMCVLTLVSVSRKFMVRYMVGSQEDEFTNAPSQDNDNVQNMPSFNTADSSWDDDLIPKDENGNPIEGGLQGQYIDRYDDNGGSFYDMQTTSIISVSDKVPTTQDESKFFQHWVLVDENEDVVRDTNGAPIVIEPNGAINLHALARYAVGLSKDIGVDSNYYILRLKGVWSDLPQEFKFYIRMVWTDDETGQSHVMDLVQNVTTSSTDANLIENDRLVVTVNTVTDTFKNWFKLHPFYAYASRNFIPTAERPEDQIPGVDGVWEAYPTDFTEGSTEQSVPDPTAYYRVVRDGDIVKYEVQRNGTIVLYLEPQNGRLPITKTVFGAGADSSVFTYTIKAQLLQSDIDRSNLEPGSPGYLTAESLKNLLPSGTFFGMAPDADMTELQGFTGAVVDLHFTRHAEGENLGNWYSEGTFTLKGGEATVLGIPQAEYTIIEKDVQDRQGNAFAYNVTVNGAHSPDREAVQEVRVGDVVKAVDFVNEVRPVAKWPGLTTTINGADGADIPNATFDYTLNLTSGYAYGVSIQSASDSITTTNGKGIDRNPFGTVNFTFAGTYEFLVTETLRSADNVITPTNQSKAVTVVVENVNGQLTVTKIIVDGTVYTGSAVSSAEVSFTHNFKPIPPDAVRVIPQVKKILHGRSLLPSVFEFVLTQTWDQQTITATNNAAANGSAGTVLFDPIDFKEAGTYIVTVQEKIEDKPGIDYDNSVITITYQVDNVADALQVTRITYAGGKGVDNDTFENQAYVDADFEVEKEYDVRLRPGVKWDNDTFEVTATLKQAAGKVEHKGSALNLNDTASLTLTETNKKQKFDFRFYNEGIYVFEVKEVNGGLPGVTYDGSIYYVTVTVAANGEQLISAVSATKNGVQYNENTLSFYNSFSDKIDVTVKARKILEDSDLRAGQFSFVLSKEEDSDKVTSAPQATSSNDANGDVTFTIKSLGKGTYTFIMREIDSGIPGIIYDETEYRVKIEVVEVKGAPVATVTYCDADDNPLPAGEVPTFTNTYIKSSNLILGNTVTGNGANPEKEFKFTFTFKDANDAGLTESFRYELQSAQSEGDDEENKTDSLIMPLFAPDSAALTGTITSGENIQLRDGQTVTVYDLPVGTMYTVVETEYDNYTVSNDKGTGTEASGTIGFSDTEVNYTNTLNLLPPDVTIAKAQSVKGVSESPITVKEGDTVTYTITVENKGEMPAKNVIITDVVPEGLTVASISDGGKTDDRTITWTIAELSAASKQTVSFTVTVPTITEDIAWTNTAKVIWDEETDGKTSAPVTINAYAVGNLTVSKTVDGEFGDKTKAFTFTVTLTDGGSPKAGSFSYVGGVLEGSGATAPADGTLTFDANDKATVTLKHGQTITIQNLPAGLGYTVTEESAAGYTPSISNANGRIAANSTAAVSATNTYSLTSLTAAVPQITKALTGRALAAGEFAFEISCASADGVTLPESATNDADGKVQFGHITFTKPGIYAITIKESVPTENPKGGVAYDRHEVTLTYTVSDNRDGTMTVNGPAVNGSTTFTNVYTAASVTSAPTLTKALRYGLLADDQFTFAISCASTDGITLPGPATNDADGKVQFGNITFDKVGVYTVTITENVPADLGADNIKDGIKYDRHSVTITYSVIDDGNGHLVISESTASGSTTFTNESVGSLTVSKAVGAYGNTGKEFTFTVKLNNATISGTYGDMTFSAGEASIRLKHGESKTATGLPAGVGYTVTESDNDGYVVTSANETGTITANTTSTAAFTNTPTALTISKTVAGSKGDTNKVWNFRIDLPSDTTLTAGDIQFGGTYTAEAPSFSGSAITFQLKHGESISVYGLPVGTAYTVTEREANQDGYVTTVGGAPYDSNSGYTGVLSAASQTVEFRNENPAGGVVIGKTVENGLREDSGKEFVFTLTLKPSGTTLSDVYKYTFDNDTDTPKTQHDLNVVEQSSGVYTASLALKDGQSVTIEGLPVNTAVTVEETAVKGAANGLDVFKTEVQVGGGSRAETKIGTATIPGEGRSVSFAFFNVRKTGNLMLSKTIVPAVGAQIDMSAGFVFTVTLTDGSSPKAGSFSYVGGILEDSGATAPADGTLTFDANGKATVTLKHGQTITIQNLPADLSYTVTEESAAGYTPSISNANGRITANSTAAVSATNTYSLTPLTAAVPEITKALTGRTLAAEEFAFEISCASVDGVTLPESATNDADGKVQFGHITFTKPGIYAITIKESVPTENPKGGVAYDRHEVTLTYTVSDNRDGTMTVNGPAVTGDTTFTNVYTAASVTNAPTLTKALRYGRLADGQFTFAISCASTDGITLPGSATNDADGKVQFGNITFDKVGTYVVTIKESVPADLGADNVKDGIKYDTHEVTFTYEVEDDGNGDLYIAKNGPAVEGSDTFINEALGSLTVSKTVTGEGANPNTTFTFTVTMTGDDAQELVGKTYGEMTFQKNPATEAIEATITLKHGESKTAIGLPAGLQYAVTEASAEGYVQTDVTGAAGTIQKGVTATAAFTNRTAYDLTVGKRVVGTKGNTTKSWEFTITLTPPQGMSLAGTYSFTANGAVEGGSEGRITLGDGVCTIKVYLTHGQSFTIHGLMDGTQYAVSETEADQNGYGTTVTDGSGRATNGSGMLSGGDARVDFVNANPAGGVYISNKVFSDLVADKSKSYTFRITFSAEGSYAYSGSKSGTIASGETIELADGEYIYIELLPVGTVITVEEISVDENFTTTVNGKEGTSDTGTVSADATTISFEFVNTRKTSDLEISKTVTGSAGETDRAFTFVVELSDKTISGTYGDMAFSEGKAIITLKHGESKTATGLPVGIGYNVTEESAAGYTPAITGGTGSVTADSTAKVSAVNTYNIIPVSSVVPEITKILTGRALEAGEFAFELSCDFTDGITLPGSATNDGEGKVQFGNITFAKGGTYTVTIRESVPAENPKGGVTYDRHEVTLTYTVVDNGDGTMTVNEPVVNGDTTFTNTYAADSVSAAPTLTKVLKYGALEDGQFEFTMEVASTVGGWSYVDGNTATNDGEGKVQFGGITFTMAGTYVVTIKESVPADLGADNIKDGVKYDRHELTLTYEVVDDGSGNLYIAGNGPAVEGSDTFINEALGSLTVSKTVSAGSTTQNFTFTVLFYDEQGGTPLDGTFSYTGSKNGSIPNGGTVTLKHGESVTFDGLPAGTYYTVAEAPLEGYIQIGATGDTGTITKGVTAVAAFTNRAVYDLTVTKEVAGAIGLANKNTDWDFGIELTLPTEVTYPLAYQYEFSSIEGVAEHDPAAGSLTFTESGGNYTAQLRIQLKHGQTLLIHGLPAGTAYKVTEIKANQDGYGTTVSGGARNDSAAGTSSGALNARSDVRFLNANPAGGVSIKKTVSSDLVADASKSFAFKITFNAEGRYAYTGSKNGTITSGDTIELADGERIYIELLPVGTVVTAEEILEDESFTTTVNGKNATSDTRTVSDDVTTVNFDFVNTRKTGNLQVSKTVTGSAGETDRAFTFTVKLDDAIISGTYGDMTFADSEATFTLKHGERKIAIGLPAGITYTVTEAEANQDGYTTTVTGDTGTVQSGETVTAEFINRKDSTEPSGNRPQTSTPKTGDDSNLALWMALMVLSAIGMLSTMFSLNRERKLLGAKGNHMRK